ncbi:MAG: hypothetical protein LBC12_01875 [Nitrososphaerota archaeon]|jgi:hypothetical protein|nr:hypothetical protein [Nitrososphaerota archaeon]
MSSFVTLASAISKAFSKTSLDLFNFRNANFIFDQTNSIELKSGEYTDKNKTIAPYQKLTATSLNLMHQRIIYNHNITKLKSVQDSSANKPQTLLFKVPLNDVVASKPSLPRVEIIDVRTKRASGT